MIKPSILVLFVLLSSCGGNHSASVAESRSSDSTEKSLPQQQDSLSTANESTTIHDSLIDLFATKSATTVKNIGEIHLKYKLNTDSGFKELSFNYPQFSDIIFPDTAIAIIQGNHVRKSNYYLFRDKKLLFPILGMNFMITYVIDLEKNQMIDTYERRTYLPLVWVNSSNETFLVTDSPQYSEDQTAVELYAFICKLRENKFSQKKRNYIRYRTEDIFDEKSTRNQVVRILMQ